MHEAKGISRRRFMRDIGAAIFTTGINTVLPLPAWALSSPKHLHHGVMGYKPQSYFDLAFRYTPILVDGKWGRSTAINGTVPAPLLRWREGDIVTLNVSNHMEDTEHASIHWHGILVPFRMDGVPGVNFNGI